MASPVLAVALVIERFVSLCNNKVAPPNLTDEVITAPSTRLLLVKIGLHRKQSDILGLVLGRGIFWARRAWPWRCDYPKEIIVKVSSDGR